MTPSHTHRPSAGTASPALLGDKVMLAAILLSAAAAVAIGLVYYEPMLGVIGAAVAAAMGVGVYLSIRGTLLSRLLLATTQVALVALHIQLAHGELEFHFGVFVTLALLLVYLD